MLRRIRKQVIDKMKGSGIPLSYETEFTPKKRHFPVEERNKIAEQVQEMSAEQVLNEKDQNILGAKEMKTCFMDSSGNKYQPLKRKTRGKGMTGGAMTGGLSTGGAMTGGLSTGGAMTGGLATGGAVTGGSYDRVVGGAKCSCEGAGVTGGATCGGQKKKGRPKKQTFSSKIEDELIGSGFWNDFADGFMSVVKPVAGVAKALAPAPVSGVLSAIGLGKKKGKKQEPKKKEDEKLAMEVKGIKDKLGLKKSRAQIVKEVMKKHGLKMIEASKYVKEHGLY